MDKILKQGDICYHLAFVPLHSSSFQEYSYIATINI